MRLEYIINHVIKSVHAPIRQYSPDGSKKCIGGNENHDPVFCDQKFESSLLEMGTDEYPVIYLEKHPVFYSVIMDSDFRFIIGPITIDYNTSFKDGRDIGEFIAEAHNTGETSHRISCCSYETFCEETLLLFNYLKNQTMTYQELNHKNFMNEELYMSTQNRMQELYFSYQENRKVHNPYDREVREMDSIQKGDIEKLKKSMDEIFEGEYAVLSKDPLQAAKNLAIVALALACRAAIRGGVHSELAFSSNDSYILQVDSMDHVGKISALVRQAKFHYASMVQERKRTNNENELVERCKNLVFTQMHQKIVISSLAKELNITPEYLTSLFKKHEGISISQYITKEKIRQAKDMLVYSDYSVTDIALYLGYSSGSHFGKVFRSLEHMTPNSYRSKYAKKDKY